MILYFVMIASMQLHAPVNADIIPYIGSDDGSSIFLPVLSGVLGLTAGVVLAIMTDIDDDSSSKEIHLCSLSDISPSLEEDPFYTSPLDENFTDTCKYKFSKKSTTPMVMAHAQLNTYLIGCRNTLNILRAIENYPSIISEIESITDSIEEKISLIEGSDDYIQELAILEKLD